ncbi:MAG: hypothetical protein ACQESC_00055 [Nanobdellota archaeon]
MTTRNHSQFLFIISFLFLSLVLFSASANAEDIISVNTYGVSSDFQMSADTKVLSACECSTISESLRVVNQGTTALRITLESNRDYVLFADDSFVINPGDTKDIQVYIKAPCTALSEDTITIKGTSSSGKVEAFTQEVLFSNCQNLKATLPNSSISTGVCEPFTSVVSIENVGSFKETYEVSINDFEKYATMSAQEVAIAPGESKDVFVYYSLPCDIYGEYSLDFDVFALKNNRETTITQQLSIPKTHTAEVSLTGDFDICQEDISRDDILFSFTNQNNFTDSYRLKTDSPSFADDGFGLWHTIFGKKIILAPNESFNQVIELSNLDSVKKGLYPIEFSVTSLNGDVTDIVRENISVADCHDGSLTLHDVPETFYTCEGDSVSKGIDVHSTGTQESRFDLVLTAPNMLSVENKTLFLSSDESYVTSLQGIVSNDSNEYPITLDLHTKGGVVDSEEFTFVADSTSTCYGISTTGLSEKMTYDQDNVGLTFKNEGTRHGTYVVSLEDASPALELENTSISLDVGQELPVTLSVNKPLLLSANETSSDLIDTVLHGTLVIEHQGSSYTVSQPLTVEIVDHSIWYKAWTAFSSQSPCRITFELLALAFIVSLITMFARISSSKTHFAPRWKWLIAGLLAVVIALIVASTVFGPVSKDTFYTSHNLSSDNLSVILMEEDGQTVVDYNTYFFDPDDNIVTYGVSDLDQSLLDFRINGSTLELFAGKEDWYGTTNIELYVIDEYGENVSSTDLSVEVLPVEDYTLIEFIDRGCPYFNVGLLLLIALAVFFAVSMRKRPVRKNGSKKSSSKKKSRPAQIMSTTTPKKQQAKQKSKQPKNSTSTVKKGSSKKSSLSKPKRGRPKKTASTTGKKKVSSKKQTSSKNASKKKSSKKTSAKKSSKKSSSSKNPAKKASSKKKRGPGRPPKNSFEKKD